MDLPEAALLSVPARELYCLFYCFTWYCRLRPASACYFHVMLSGLKTTLGKMQLAYGCPVHEGTLPLECLVSYRFLGSLDSCTYKGKGNVSDPCRGLR